MTSAAPGTTVTYTVTAWNNGPSDVIGATVSDTVPVGVTAFDWTCGSSSGATCANATGSGAISELVDLPAGSAAVFTITATISPTASGTLDNTATVAVPSGTTDPGPGPNSATDSDVLGPIADLSVTKDDSATTATPGGSTTYTIVVTNDGPSPAIDTVVTDAIPAGATALDWTCAPSVGANCDIVNGSGAIKHDRRPPAVHDGDVHRDGRHRPRGDRHPRQHRPRHTGTGCQRPRRPVGSHGDRQR